MSDLDLAAIAAWARDHAPEIQGPLRAQKIPMGQSNPSYFLTAGSGEYVLRRKPPGVLLKSAHAVDREFRVQRALAGTDVPVARMVALCDDDAVIGSMFYVMERVQGVNHADPRLPDLATPDRGTVMASMAQVLAALHDVDVGAVGLSDYGPPGNYYERQLSRWVKQYRASEMGTVPDMDRLIDALAERMPGDDGQRGLVHGDYRIDNMIFDAQTHRCNAVLDWELSTLGHPYADLAGVVMQWSLPPGALGRGLAGVDRTAQGLPSDADFIAAYCAARGLAAVPDLSFYVAFAFFRMGAILQGVAKRAADGNASDPEGGAKMGAMVPMFAQGGLRALGEVS